MVKCVHYKFVTLDLQVIINALSFVTLRLTFIEKWRLERNSNLKPRINKEFIFAQFFGLQEIREAEPRSRHCQSLISLNTRKGWYSNEPNLKKHQN